MLKLKDRWAVHGNEGMRVGCRSGCTKRYLKALQSYGKSIVPTMIVIEESCDVLRRAV